LTILITSITTAQAQSLSGLCLDNREPGCMPRFIPFKGLTIDFCEETCALQNPVKVKGLEAVLYDMVCQADFPTKIGGRVMLLEQKSGQDQSSLLFIDKREVRKIVACP
jgi:hypothetical protein